MAGAIALDRIADGIILEIDRQYKIWGHQSRSNVYWLAILAEEFGEAAMAVLAPDHNANPKTTKPHDSNIHTELIQIIAVCYNWLRDLDAAE